MLTVETFKAFDTVLFVLPNIHLRTKFYFHRRKSLSLNFVSIPQIKTSISLRTMKPFLFIIAGFLAVVLAVPVIDVDVEANVNLQDMARIIKRDESSVCSASATTDSTIYLTASTTASATTSATGSATSRAISSATSRAISSATTSATATLSRRDPPDDCLVPCVWTCTDRTKKTKKCLKGVKVTGHNPCRCDCYV